MLWGICRILAFCRIPVPLWCLCYKRQAKWIGAKERKQSDWSLKDANKWMNDVKYIFYVSYRDSSIYLMLVNSFSWYANVRTQGNLLTFKDTNGLHSDILRQCEWTNAFLGYTKGLCALRTMFGTFELALLKTSHHSSYQLLLLSCNTVYPNRHSPQFCIILFIMSGMDRM